MKSFNRLTATGYGLTFGLHTRIDDRVQSVLDSVHAGNIYVNRNQIGAVVGSQPFGGEGLSGTGPKAGGPLYLTKFTKGGENVAMNDVSEMPGPTGETNRLSIAPRDPFLSQIDAISKAGGRAKAGSLDDVDDLTGVSGLVWWGDAKTARELRQKLA
ncbi:Bifunctional protein PutA [Nymphon striatum]|nr:Bifunctional protein PutA [Nymphon striatum]